MDEKLGNQPEWGIKLSAYFIIPQRVIFSIMCCLSLICAYTMRIGLSVAITRMVPLRNYTADTSVAVCEPYSISNDAVVDEYQYDEGDVFDWSQSHQGFILGAFYIGYIIGHVPAGLLSEKFGGKWVLAFSLFGSAVFTILTPTLVYFGGDWIMIILRILIGLSQGGIYPSLGTLLAQWIPLKERGILGVIILGGCDMGTALASIFSGMLLKRFHWASVFYVSGFISLIWVLLFVLLCYSDPISHPFIKPSEKEYIFEELGFIQRVHDLPMFPWGPVFKSCAFHTILLGHVAHDWSFYVMVSDLPKYMNDVMQFPIQDNGFINAFPSALMWVMTLGYGFLTDMLIRKKIFSVGGTRKFVTVISAVVPSTMLVAASYAGCNHILVVVFFTLGMGFMGGYYAGIKLAPNDMSPNYAGTLAALANGTGALAGVFGPVSVGWMTPNTTLEEWRLVFWVAFMVRIFMALPYIICGTGEVQEWNDVRAMEAKKKALAAS